METLYWVYILTNKPYGTFYVGVTNNLQRRIFEHREGLIKGFTKDHGVKTLVWCGEFRSIEEAIAHEKRLKKWRRDWKIELIEKINSTWRDLYEELNQ